MAGFFKSLGRGLLGVAYACIPVIGWIALARSFKKVNAGEISIINKLNGGYEILEQGFYFRPAIGDKFGETKSLTEDYIDLGPVKRIRVKNNQRAVKNVNGTYQLLGPGFHLIDNAKGEVFNKDKDIQDINKEDYWLGATRYVTIRNGELGESYDSGKFVLLDPGKHELPPNHVYKGKVPINDSVVDLGALKIVTVKDGQRAIVNGQNGNKILGPGKHYIKQEEGNYYSGLITISRQVIDLPEMVVMCTDKLEIRAKSVLMFEIEDPLKIVGAGKDRVLHDLALYAEGTLREILRVHSFTDLSLPMSEDANHPSQDRAKLLREIHKNFVDDLSKQVAGWGIKINDLKFTILTPADEKYHETIREIGRNISTQDAAKALAERKAEVNYITAEAEKSKVKAAEIEQNEAIIRGETKAKTMAIEADAEYNKTVRAAEAKAAAIAKISEAETKRLARFGEAADGLKTDISKKLAMVEKKGEILKNIPGAVFVQPKLGSKSVWKTEGNNTTFFQSQSDKKPQSSNVADWLALETADRTRQLPQMNKR